MPCSSGIYLNCAGPDARRPRMLLHLSTSMFCTEGFRAQVAMVCTFLRSRRQARRMSPDTYAGHSDCEWALRNGDSAHARARRGTAGSNLTCGHPRMCNEGTTKPIARRKLPAPACDSSNFCTPAHRDPNSSCYMIHNCARQCKVCRTLL